MRFAISTIAIGLMALGASSAAYAGETITYTYDALGRLVKTVSSGTVNNNQTHSICYDEAGNRVTYKSDSGGSAASCVTQG